MDRTIWKFPIAVLDKVTLTMPCDAEILCVQVQHGHPQLWALVSRSASIADRHFRWVGTGHPVDFVGRYIGTVQLHEGALVLHLFEI
jgi:hypothetical protein